MEYFRDIYFDNKPIIQKFPILNSFLRIEIFLHINLFPPILPNGIVSKGYNKSTVRTTLVGLRKLGLVEEKYRLFRPTLLGSKVAKILMSIPKLQSWSKTIVPRSQNSGYPKISIDN